MVIGFIVAPDSTQTISTNSQTQNNQQVTTDKHITGKLSDIQVSIDAQSMPNTKGQFKTVIYVENTSSDMFWGNVEVESIDVDGKTIDNALLFIKSKDDPLLSGQKTQGIVWLKKAVVPKYKYHVSGDFAPYTGYKTAIDYTISKSTIGPGGGTVWVLVSDVQQKTLIDISKEFIDKYSSLQTLTVYFFINEADMETYTNYVSLSWSPGEKPHLQYWDSTEKILIE
ncbi:MAG: hypothetical protein HPY74_20710 [Firmicutes bacterium]|nr:hypothetical protein [Bacillota bacterium]